VDTVDSRRKRLPREERERHILTEAVAFFAEMGFEGQTRALADRLGVTQPLLYRYFPDKDTLIERVFDEVYLKRWRPEWESLLADRSKPLEQRLKVFYRNYCSTIFTQEWVRIFMFAGLKGEAVNRRYLENVHNKVLSPICAEFRHALGLPSPDALPIDEMEINVAWALHGAVFYIAVRKWIYRLPMLDDLTPLIDSIVDAYVLGTGEAMRQMIAARMGETR
jgi:AcrR family transcriptional regulator